MDAQTAFDRIAQSGLMAGMRGKFPPEVALDHTAVLLEQGQIDILEFTMNSERPLEAMQAAIGRRVRHESFGMGTVLDAEMARRVVDAGADYLIAPSFNREVVEVGHAAGLLVIPGVITPTEAVDAWATGAKLLKIFPIGVLGLEYFKAVRSPLSHIKFMCNGGMDDSNVGDFLKAGAVACGMAGWLTGNGTMPLEQVGKRAALLREIVTSVRTGQKQRLTV
ncbi:MAG: bifunctional 4-hydroxy-2-oxoglutarate aldolase/2-dehydro-3-deoxy-phosphogluconate aldolase [Chloroflexota bacterium]